MAWWLAPGGSVGEVYDHQTEQNQKLKGQGGWEGISKAIAA